MQQSSLGAGSLVLVPVMRMQCVWPSRPCLGASDRTSSMCLQAAPRVKADEANHPKSYSPKPLASRTEPIQVSRFGSTVSQVALNSSSHMQLQLITHRNRLCTTTHSHSTKTSTGNHQQPLNPSNHVETQATTPQAATGNHKHLRTASNHENRWQPLEPHSF